MQQGSIFSPLTQKAIVISKPVMIVDDSHGRRQTLSLALRGAGQEVDRLIIFDIRTEYVWSRQSAPDSMAHPPQPAVRLRAKGFA